MTVPENYGVLDGPIWMSEDQAEARNQSDRKIVNEHATMSYLLFCYSSGIMVVDNAG